MSFSYSVNFRGWLVDRSLESPESIGTSPHKAISIPLVWYALFANALNKDLMVSEPSASNKRYVVQADFVIGILRLFLKIELAAEENSDLYDTAELSGKPVWRQFWGR
ncbi:hypothetical protein [[Eubacterium] cellulosolvens]